MENFEYTELGFLVWKSFGGHYTPPKEWKIKAGEYLIEAVEENAGIGCGMGINFGTPGWFRNEGPRSNEEPGGIWMCILHYEDVKYVVLPVQQQMYHQHGSMMPQEKARCMRLQLFIECIPISAARKSSIRATQRGRHHRGLSGFPQKGMSMYHTS